MIVDLIIYSYASIVPLVNVLLVGDQENKKSNYINKIFYRCRFRFVAKGSNFSIQ